MQYLPSQAQYPPHKEDNHFVRARASARAIQTPASILHADDLFMVIAPLLSTVTNRHNILVNSN
ncbi:hypothetical protein PC117_g8469 [Phytophthora cactorum]|uniref:Uncharacterized protein n=1 Tax=Phytophthora cactorum TaxID=29920 RepID=A0A8T1E1N4_9STRA|nr:hypothetical protein PC117_g8469 [Phytophthora cactorum]KAG4053327.1 hypothetical protein PC123_g11517 [Phytophthora cactorum]